LNIFAKTLWYLSARTESEMGVFQTVSGSEGKYLLRIGNRENVQRT